MSLRDLTQRFEQAPLQQRSPSAHTKLNSDNHIIELIMLDFFDLSLNWHLFKLIEALKGTSIKVEIQFMSTKKIKNKK